MLGWLSCRFNRHVPLSRQAEWDGLHYIAKCERCGKRIRRVRKGVWRKVPVNPPD